MEGARSVRSRSYLTVGGTQLPCYTRPVATMHPITVWLSWAGAQYCADTDTNSESPLKALCTLLGISLPLSVSLPLSRFLPASAHGPFRRGGVPGSDYECLSLPLPFLFVGPWGFIASRHGLWGNSSRSLRDGPFENSPPYYRSTKRGVLNSGIARSYRKKCMTQPAILSQAW